MSTVIYIYHHNVSPSQIHLSTTCHPLHYHLIIITTILLELAKKDQRGSLDFLGRRGTFAVGLTRRFENLDSQAAYPQKYLFLYCPTRPSSFLLKESSPNLYFWMKIGDLHSLDTGFRTAVDGVSFVGVTSNSYLRAHRIGSISLIKI